MNLAHICFHFFHCAALPDIALRVLGRKQRETKIFVQKQKRSLESLCYDALKSVPLKSHRKIASQMPHVTPYLFFSGRSGWILSFFADTVSQILTVNKCLAEHATVTLAELFSTWTKKSFFLFFNLCDRTSRTHNTAATFPPQPFRRDWKRNCPSLRTRVSACRCRNRCGTQERVRPEGWRSSNRYTTSRVTRWDCDKIAQNVAQSIFC
jgi:hypothetical protein